MPLTDTQKTRVRKYLGYDRGYDLSYELESKMDALSAEEITEVSATLTALAALETRMNTVTTNGMLEALSVGKVDLRPGDLLENHASQGRRLVAQLEAMLQVDARRDYFGQGAGASGGVIPLG